MSEKFDFKVSVDGFPEMFMSGNSPGEVKTALRKLVKQPSMIKSVDRVTKAEKKKEFRKKVREEKCAGDVDYGSDESVKIMKKRSSMRAPHPCHGIIKHDLLIDDAHQLMDLLL